MAYSLKDYIHNNFVLITQKNKFIKVRLIRTIIKFNV